MKTRKINLPRLQGDDYEQEFVEFMGSVIPALGIDPEEVPQLMYRVYKDEIMLPFADDYR